MPMSTDQRAVKDPPSTPATHKAFDIVSASVPDTLAALKVNPDTGLAAADVDARRKGSGYNEVAAKKRHPVVKFLQKFLGISAWMLELPDSRARLLASREEGRP